jgi:HEAT repeat protein
LGAPREQAALRPQTPAARERAQADAGETAPRTLFVATPDRLFEVTVPGDAWRAEEAGFEVTLPEEIKTSCLALVLESADAPRGAKNPRVTMAEVTARTEFDGQGAEALVGALAGGGERARAAAALLARSGSVAIQAAMAGYEKLDEQGRLLAAGVIDAAPCAEQAPFFVERLAAVAADEASRKKQRRQDDLLGPDPEAHHARDRIRRCGRAAAPVLAKIVVEGRATPGATPAKRGADPVRVAAARELALAAPAEAVPALLDAIAAANEATRRELRSALAQAAQSERSREALASELSESRFRARPELAQIDFLRAMGPLLGQVEGAGAAFHLLASPGASFRARYLLLAPAAELARAGDARADAWLRAALRKDADHHVRVRAGEVAWRVPALAPDLLAAADDPEVRVREAAIGSLGRVAGEGAKAPPEAEAALVARLSSDPWTFVRAGAARALGSLPAGAAGDRALAAALADASPDVRGNALDALGARRAVAYASAVRERAEDKEENVEVQARAILALAEMCDRASVDLWTKLALRARSPLGERDHRLGTAALAALGHVHPADLKERLAPMFEKGTPRALQEMARAAIEAPGQCR